MHWGPGASGYIPVTHCVICFETFRIVFPLVLPRVKDGTLHFWNVFRLVNITRNFPATDRDSLVVMSPLSTSIFGLQSQSPTWHLFILWFQWPTLSVFYLIVIKLLITWRFQDGNKSNHVICIRLPSPTLLCALSWPSESHNLRQ